MTFDWDDFCESGIGYQTLHRLHQLKAINSAFRCTLFTIPAKCSPSFLDEVPRWIELAVHGWHHNDVYECSEWTMENLFRVMDDDIVRRYFVHGFKAPGWQISNACYDALVYRKWWVADQHLEDERRPVDLPTYFYENGNWHGHVQNVCGNGLEETWDEVVGLVRDTQDFRFASEALS